MTATTIVQLVETVVDDKRLGRHVEHDPRSRGYAVDELGAAAIKSVQHRRYGNPLNQLRLGSCTGNAITGVKNTAPFASSTKGLKTETDAVHVYEQATIIDGIPGQYPPDDTGSSGLAVCKVAKTLGWISGYKHAFSVNGALSALQAQPVITGVPWYEGFDSPDADALVKIAGQIRGGHEFEIKGFQLASSNSPILDGLVAAENSWGLGYGKRGCFFFTARTWADLLDQQGDVTVPLAVKP